jgi:hypothetical protein
MTLESPADIVIYRSRLNAKINRDFEVFTPSTSWRPSPSTSRTKVPKWFAITPGTRPKRQFPINYQFLAVSAANVNN